MICYKDRSFCSEGTCAAECFFRLTQYDNHRASEMNLPVSFVPMRDTDDCPGYVSEDED